MLVPFAVKLTSKRGSYRLSLRSNSKSYIFQVHLNFELMPKTLYLTVNIFDRYLSIQTVTRMELQLVGITVMLIASSDEEIWPPEVG